MRFWLVLLGACRIEPQPDRPHSDSGDTASWGICEGPTPYTEDQVGTISCSQYRCEVEAGPFWMGASVPSAPDQCPPRQVELGAFSIDRTEVTLGAYQECVDAGDCDAMPSHCETFAEVDPDTLLLVLWASRLGRLMDAQNAAMLREFGLQYSDYATEGNIKHAAHGITAANFMDAATLLTTIDL